MWLLNSSDIANFLLYTVNREKKTSWFIETQLCTYAAYINPEKLDDMWIENKKKNVIETKFESESVLNIHQMAVA